MGGNLDIAIQKRPGEEWNPAEGDHHTNLGIEPEEWEKLFVYTLGAPIWEKYVEGEDIEDYYNRQKDLFQATLMKIGYPMLSRIWRIYQDACYYPAEVGRLRSECAKLRGLVRDLSAQSAVEKLIAASDVALRANSGIALLSD